MSAAAFRYNDFVLRPWSAIALVMMLGCAHPQEQPNRELEAYQRQMYVATLAWYNAVQVAHVQLRMAQMSKDHQAVQFANKLDEMLVLNSELEKRLAHAEKALEEIKAIEQREGTPLPEGTERVLAELKQMRQTNDERAKAYRELLRNMQHMVDSGRIKAVIDQQGRVRFVAPPELDGADPWL